MAMKWTNGLVLNVGRGQPNTTGAKERTPSSWLSDCLTANTIHTADFKIPSANILNLRDRILSHSDGFGERVTISTITQFWMHFSMDLRAELSRMIECSLVGKNVCVARGRYIASCNQRERLGRISILEGGHIASKCLDLPYSLEQA